MRLCRFWYLTTVTSAKESIYKNNKTVIQGFFVFKSVVHVILI
jgi:hypothetical protein